MITIESGYTDAVLETIKTKIKHILRNICPSHGYSHAIQVWEHCKLASSEADLELKIRFLVQLGGLLHDVDDTKFFPSHTNYENLRSVMVGFDSADTELVIEMVSYVSSSKNGDAVPPRAVANPWLLYPRYADRLEAIGVIGVARCYKYTLSTFAPLYTESTPKATDVNDLWNRIATVERYVAYKGSSNSFIDHFYDKLLRLSGPDTKNRYFESVKANQTQIMVDIVMGFAATGGVDVPMLNDLVSKL